MESDDHPADLVIVIMSMPAKLAAEVLEALQECAVKRPVSIPASLCVSLIQRAIVEDDAAPCGFVVATKKPISDEMVKRYLRYILAVITGHRSGSCGNALKVMGLASKPCLECFNTESKVNVHSESVR